MKNTITMEFTAAELSLALNALNREAARLFNDDKRKTAEHARRDRDRSARMDCLAERITMAMDDAEAAVKAGV